MKKKNINAVISIIFSLMLINTVSSQIALADYSGGEAELKDALNGSERVRYFSQTAPIKIGTDLPGVNGDGSIFTFDGHNYDIDGNSKKGFSLYSGQTLNIKNAGSADNAGIISTSIKNFYRGYASGGVVSNNGGTLNVINSVFSNNKVDNDENGTGGVILTTNGAKASVTGSVFDSNIAQWGGAISNYYGGGTTSIDNTLFSNNHASYEGGAIYNNSYGGVAFTEIKNSKFLNNSSDESGGAIFNKVSTPESASAVTLTIDNSFFSGNYATNANYGYGGALFNYGGKVSITNTQFLGNYANSGGAIDTETYNDSNNYVYNAMVSLKNCTFDNNSVTKDAGAIYNYGGLLNIENTTFTNNKATSGGAGAILNDSGTLLVSGGSFDNNIATTAGAIYNTGSMTLTGVSFTNNSSTADDGGAVYNTGNASIKGGLFDTNTAKGNGGAIYNTGNMSIADGLYSKNTATTGNGGAIYNTGNASIVGGSYSNNAAMAGKGGFAYNTGNLSLTNASVANNTANIDGGAIYNTGLTSIIGGSYSSNTSTTGNGGAIYNTGKASIDGGSYSNNAATAGKGGFAYNTGNLSLTNASVANNTANIDGGAIYNTGLTSIVGGTYSNNTATTGNGGAIYNTGNTSTTGLNITNASITNNKASAGNGGAIYNTGNTSIIGGVYSSNTANVYGGAVYNTGVMTITGASFADNATTTGGGGAIYNYGGNLNVSDSNFSNNKAEATGGSVGGAIQSGYYGGNATVTRSIFDNNTASWGGAFATFDGEGTSTIDFSTFSNNHAGVQGGAIYSYGFGGIVLTAITNSNFLNNSSTYAGGAIFNKAGLEESASSIDLTIDHSSFSGNNAPTNLGGALYNASGNVIITNSQFLNNYSTDGGAFYINGGSLAVSGTNFENNYSTASDGGAIDTETGTILNFKNSSFKNNKAAGNGGAIYSCGASLTAENTSFAGNQSSGIYGGGAIYSDNDTSNLSNIILNKMKFTNTAFSNNTAKVANGGAIFNSGETTLINSSFTNNTATVGNGGAIYNNGILNVVADGGNSTFTGNKASGVSNAIYLVSGSTLNLNASGNSSITFNDKIAGDASGTSVNINKSGVVETGTSNLAPTTGIVKFNNTVATTSDINLYGGTMALGTENLLNGNTLNVKGNSYISMINGSMGTMSLGNFNVAANTTANLGIDVDLAKQTSDRFTPTNASLGSNSHVNISNINAVTDAVAMKANISVVDPSFANSVSSNVSTVMGPIFKYNVNYDPTSGMLGFSGISGGSYTNYNPAILSKTISSLTGTYLNQVNVYTEALSRADIFMSLPQLDRMLMRYQNKYASAEDPMVFSPLYTPSEKGGIWVKQYTTFENIPLNNGPNVSNVSYGTLVGADTEMKHLKHDCDGYLTAYVGYNGSHQNYNQVGIYQNGGVLGLTGTLYKNNFFTALTANVGATNGNASTTFGTDNFTTLLAGLAWKAGYNIELFKGKIIIQPSYAMSYTYANTYDYQTASGLNITSDPLNALQISPGVKIISNMKNGWQPFLAANMVWNLMDSQKFRANDVELPMMSIDPYFEYGLGVQRKWGDRFTGFGQAMARGGGRNGLALQFGFRFAIGK